MEEELRALLQGDSAVAAIVGTRVNYLTHPQGAPRPGIVLTVVNDSPTYTLDGEGAVSDARVQVDCYADAYAQAKELSRAVRSLLSGYRGGLLQGVFLAGTRDGREGGSNEAERPYRISMDFMVHHTTT